MFRRAWWPCNGVLGRVPGLMGYHDHSFDFVSDVRGWVQLLPAWSAISIFLDVLVIRSLAVYGHQEARKVYGAPL